STLWILLAYFLLNLLYSFFFKSVVLIDVFLIALGFILRLLAGAAAADVGLSAWILVTTFFLSLFLGFAKRKSQSGMEDRSREPDAAGSLYTGEYLNALVIVSMALTVASYSLYTISFMQREGFRSDLMPVTIIFVAYGLFRYLYLIPIREGTGDPVDIVWRDIPILIDIALWLGWVLAVYLLPANQVR
ncbi:MAG TPA: decaprenyl-phosphate phosphoribosyltransferase, partial [Spirochaetia bacterium]|nr:decaprenyl-phosphate phosphoribosyltransferase [Spirochaetia bacterium]